MIAGLFLRNYKCYSNINFIPFIRGQGELINVFIGANGVGKSTLLEALNCVLNDVNPRTWETTVAQKRERTYIGPVFLIAKKDFPGNDQTTAISDAFWTANFSSADSNDPVAQFVVWRDELKKTIDVGDYYLICIGKDYGGNVLLTSSLHKKIFNQTRRLGVSAQCISELFKSIQNHYNYIYIPVENKISDILDLQAKEMQGLMDKSVSEEIKNILSLKEYSREDARKKVSVVDLINEKLDHYISEINEKMTEGYKFAPRGAKKQTIKPNDILHIILDEYFSIRPLTKDGKHIKSLSSGQQRLALIDVASTLLNSDAEKTGAVVLAIDEPENSLESANRFKQFSRLVDIAEQKRHQIFITTHWYGLLLRPCSGRLNFVCDTIDAPTVMSFSMKNLYDRKRDFPDSMEMKSYFDLMGSMLSLLKQDNFNWLICEGLEDAEYLGLYLKDKVKNLYILPFNGCGNVKKLYEFLSVPFSDEGEKKQIKGKVYCIIDTDTKNLMTVQGYKGTKQLRFERLTLDREKNHADLISVANVNATNTCIEDVLDPSLMWQTVNKLSDKNARLKTLLKEFKFNNDAEYSDITGELAFMMRNSHIAHKVCKEVKSILMSEEMKKDLAQEYVSVAKESDHLIGPKWMEKISNYFNGN